MAAKELLGSLKLHTKTRHRHPNLLLRSLQLLLCPGLHSLLLKSLLQTNKLLVPLLCRGLHNLLWKNLRQIPKLLAVLCHGLLSLQPNPQFSQHSLQRENLPQISKLLVALCHGLLSLRRNCQINKHNRGLLSLRQKNLL